MPIGIILHIAGEEPLAGEIDDLPGVESTMVKISHPRKIDGKDLSYLADGVTTVFWPLWRINFIEILPGREEEELIGFVRE